MVLIPTGFAQVNLVFRGAALPFGAETTFGIDVSTSPLDPLEVAQAVRTNLFEAQVMNFIGAQIDLKAIRVKFGPTATGPSAEFATTIPGGPAAPAAPNVATLVRKVTNLGGRAGRGRMYWPSVPENMITSDGLVAEEWRPGMQVTFDDFLEKQVADGLGLVVLHDTGSPLSGGTPVQSLVLDNRVATQRRRLRR